MVNVSKMNKKEFIQCASCKSTDRKTNFYQIEFGKTKCLKLCHDCFIDLGNQIYEIYQEETDFIDEEE